MNRAIVICMMLPALTLQACSSTPREFTPILAAPASNQAELDTAHATCRHLLVEGKLTQMAVLLREQRGQRRA